MIYVVILMAIFMVVVFVHSIGHYLMARLCNVPVDSFSFGIGKELRGWTDKAGTRWCLRLLPIGGYVRISSGAEPPQSTSSKGQMADERISSFWRKQATLRFAINAGGPAANFAFAVVGLSIMFMVLGQPVAESVIGEVLPGSAASEAGLVRGDRVLAIDGEAVVRFADIQRIVRLKVDQPLTLAIQRGERQGALVIRPRVIARKDLFGDIEKVPVIGLTADPERVRVIRHNPMSALMASLDETGQLVTRSFVNLGQMLNGTRARDERGGAFRITKGLSEASGLPTIANSVLYAIFLSVNFGLINLFSLPGLDGLRLFSCAAEALIGRTRWGYARKYGPRMWLFLFLALVAFATRNDIASLPLWASIKRLFS